MTNLVFIQNDQAVTSTLVIASETGNEHASVILLVRKYVADLEEFGRVDLKSHRQERGGTPTEYAILNEPQTTLLLTYMRNSEVVRTFKKALVGEFYRMAEELRRGPATALPDFSDPVAAARAWADAYEAKIRLEQDNQLLNTIIDNEFGYCSILRAAQHLGVSETVFNWRPLKKRTLEMGAEVKKVPSPRYAYQNLYPISAFEFCYPEYDFTGLQPEAVATRATKLLTGQTGMTAH